MNRNDLTNDPDHIALHRKIHEHFRSDELILLRRQMNSVLSRMFWINVWQWGMMLVAVLLYLLMREQA